jgi:hypothetical protein
MCCDCHCLCNFILHLWYLHALPTSFSCISSLIISDKNAAISCCSSRISCSVSKWIMPTFLHNEKKSYSKHLWFARKKDSWRACWKMTDGLRISACYSRGFYFSWPSPTVLSCMYVESSWNVMAHGDAREGEWRGNWRMEWVASTLHTTSEHGVSSITTADMRTRRLPAVDWTDAPADLNGFVRFGERRNLVSAGVPSHFKRSLQRFWHGLHCRLQRDKM